MKDAMTYSKDELLAILHEWCPDALAKFPDASTFTIDTSHAVPRLHIGYTMTPKSHESKGPLWVSLDTAVGFPRTCYTNDDGSDVHFKRIVQNGFKGNESFSKLSEGEVVKEKCVRALYAFIMLLRGYTESFPSYKTKGTTSLALLKRGLDRNARRSSETGNVGAGAQVAEGDGKKRDLESDNEESLVVKKARTE